MQKYKKKKVKIKCYMYIPAWNSYEGPFIATSEVLPPWRGGAKTVYSLMRGFIRKLDVGCNRDA